jgi:hypothetical protein
MSQDKPVLYISGFIEILLSLVVPSELSIYFQRRG